MSIADFVKEKWLAMLIVILLCISFFLAYDLFFAGEQSSFRIQDKCGLFYNLLSHTINDENDCRVKCTYQCEAQDSSYKKSEFNLGVKACNNCTCFCNK